MAHLRVPRWNCKDRDYNRIFRACLAIPGMLSPHREDDGMPQRPSVDDVLNLLHEHGQRATYGAVAGIVGGVARGVMQGRAKTPRHSWVVSSGSGLPTKYTGKEIDSRLPKSGPTIADANQLKVWLRGKGLSL